MDEKLSLSPEASGINAVRAKRRNKLLPVVERFHAHCGMQGKKRNLYTETGRDHAISGQHKQTQGMWETREAQLAAGGCWKGWAGGLGSGAGENTWVTRGHICSPPCHTLPCDLICSSCLGPWPQLETWIPAGGRR